MGTVSRPRSIRPRKAPRSQQLIAVLRLLGRPDPGLLEAALEPADAQAIQDRAKDEPAETLLGTAIAVCLEVHDLWQRMTTAQRTQVRGFSLPLLGLAADQALCLERALTECTALSAEHSFAVARLRELGPRAALLCTQAAHVLEKVAGEQRVSDEEHAPAPNTTFGFAQNLHRLAHAGQKLVRSENATVRKRALLYGLNDSFLDGLASAGRELVSVNEKASGTGPLRESQTRLDQARRATFLLVTQIADAFGTARKIEPGILPLQTAPKKVRVEAAIVKRPLELPASREPHLVVVTVEQPKEGTPIAVLARSAERLVVPAKTSRVLDVGDFGASGMIRKKSKPPLR
jgi:hypothetical protein